MPAPRKKWVFWLMVGVAGWYGYSQAQKRKAAAATAQAAAEYTPPLQVPGSGIGPVIQVAPGIQSVSGLGRLGLRS
jgi:hypothetical protein